MPAQKLVDTVLYRFCGVYRMKDIIHMGPYG